MSDLALSEGLSGEIALYDIDVVAAKRNADISKQINNDSKCKSTENNPIEFIKNLFLEGQKNGEFITGKTPKECMELFLSIIQGATLIYVIAPKEIRKNMHLPSPDFILDIFCKGVKNEK